MQIVGSKSSDRNTTKYSKIIKALIFNRRKLRQAASLRSDSLDYWQQVATMYVCYAYSACTFKTLARSPRANLLKPWKRVVEITEITITIGLFII